MATKTETKNAPRKEELLKKAHDAIEIFRNYLNRDNYVVELHDTIIFIRTDMVKCYLSRYTLSITYDNMDIMYKSDKSEILLFDTTTTDITRYEILELRDVMAQLRKYVIEKVKQRLKVFIKTFK
jgi:hypothetical protein